MFEYTKNEIMNIAKANNYLPGPTEKVIRLAKILLELGNLSDRFKLVLKGGTALNLFYLDCKRLSIDIDYDLEANIDKDTTSEFKNLIREKVLLYADDNGYIVTDGSKEYHTLHSFVLNYETVNGGRDSLKIEINYSDRQHICKPQLLKMTKKLTIPSESYVLDSKELIGSKLSAFIHRTVPRDMYDVFGLLENGMIYNDIEEIMDIFTFYMVIGGKDSTPINELIKNTEEKILVLDYPKIRDNVRPLIAKNEKVDIEKMKATLIDFLPSLKTNDKQTLFEEKFYQGEYKPEILFGENNNVKEHPMALWKIKNL